VTSTTPVIEVKLAGAVVRVSSGMDGAMLTAVLRAVRASTSRT
jgi:transposase